MSPHRKTSRAAGVLYLLTFVAIPTLALYDGISNAAVSQSLIFGPQLIHHS
jgi:hypothetical protein